MRLNHIIVLTTLAIIVIGVFFSKWPVAQYFGNTLGVLLGFLLGVWWQEKEKYRSKKEKDDAFWKDFKIFLPVFKIKVDSQKGNTSYDVFDNVFEHRLPLPELIYFDKQANELGLDSELRRQISEMVWYTKTIEEYIDLGADRIKLGGKFRSNFLSKQEALSDLVLKIKNRYVQN
jgi:hypothetical protein